MGLHFLADSVPWRLWNLHLAARSIEHCAISVDEELVVYVPALYGSDCVCVYRVARLHATLGYARDVHVWRSGAADAESVGFRFHGSGGGGYVISSWRGHLEFSMQVGTGGNGARATGGRAVRSRGGVHF